MGEERAGVRSGEHVLGAAECQALCREQGQKDAREEALPHEAPSTGRAADALSL